MNLQKMHEDGWWRHPQRGGDRLRLGRYLVAEPPLAGRFDRPARPRARAWPSNISTHSVNGPWRARALSDYWQTRGNSDDTRPIGGPEIIRGAPDPCNSAEPAKHRRGSAQGWLHHLQFGRVDRDGRGLQRDRAATCPSPRREQDLTRPVVRTRG